MKKSLIILFVIFTSCQDPPVTREKTPPPAIQPVTVADSLEKEEEEYRPVIDYDTSQWTDLAIVEPSLMMEIRYATTNNFVEEKMYSCGRCFLRPEVARHLLAAQQELQEKGLGLKMFDCYRPRPVQWKLWKKVPDPRYVSDPAKGSVHNRGGAVDLTIVDHTGNELDMGTPYDYFGREAYHTTTDLPEQVLANRQLLKTLMDKHGFRSIRTEWWHYSYRRRSFPLSDWEWNCPEKSR